jgi:hypothetical protein
MTHTTHNLCMSKKSPPLLLLSHGFVAIKEKNYCPSFVCRESQIHCATEQVALHFPHSWEFPHTHTHTEGSIWLRNLSLRVPALTIAVPAASCAVHSFTDTHTLKQILLSTVEQ